MTFGNFVLGLRRRLQDLRTTTNVLIDNPATNGIRWSSNHLVEITNMALVESVRLIHAYSQFTQLTRLAKTLIYAEVDLTLTTNESAIDDTVLYIDGVKDANDELYQYIEPEKYFAYATETGEPRVSANYYTVLYDVAATARKVVCTSATGTLTVSYLYNKHNYSIASNESDTVHLIGIDDILLDVAEKECRDREGNMERSMVLEKRIMIKLGIGGKSG